MIALCITGQLRLGFEKKTEKTKTVDRVESEGSLHPALSIWEQNKKADKRGLMK